MNAFLLYVGIILGILTIPFLEELTGRKIPRESYEKWCVLIEAGILLLVIGLLFTPLILSKLSMNLR